MASVATKTKPKDSRMKSAPKAVRRKPQAPAGKPLAPTLEKRVSEMSQEEMLAMWRKYKRRKTQAIRNKLIERYLPLVKYNSERVWAKLPDEVQLDDLVSAGIFGLMDAIDAFDLSREVKFETYCAPRIRGAILDELRNMDWVPRLVRSRAHQLARARVQVEAKVGRAPKPHELAKHLKLSETNYDKLVRDAHAVTLVPLNRARYMSDSSREVCEIDVIRDRTADMPDRTMQEHDVRGLVTRGLSRTERLIMILYYYEEMTMKEIGATLDLSESRVSQMHSAILERLRGQLRDRQGEFMRE